MIYQKHCPGCFENKSSLPVCPVCGYDESATRSTVFLPHGLVLGGQYRVGRVLGQPGGFGITYVGWDVYLQQRVAIKEYLPRSIAERRPGSHEVWPHGENDRRSFEFGKDQFLREARIVAKFDHPNIVRVRNFFNANGTAYLVMDYYEGMSLGDYLGGVRSRIDAEVAVGLMLPVLDGLEYVHQRGVVHRDMKPHNIYLAAIGRPIVLDFGAARQAVGDLTPTLSLMLTEGYAPIEQYQRNAPQAPCTDVYGVGATLYRMIAGVAPPMALDRVGRDPLDPAGWSKLPDLLRPAMRKALGVRPEQRFQSAGEFSLALGSYLAQTPHPMTSPSPLTLAGNMPMSAPPAPRSQQTKEIPPITGAPASTVPAKEPPPFVPRPPPAPPRRMLRPLLLVLTLAASLWAWYLTHGGSGPDFQYLSARLLLPLPTLIDLPGGELTLGETSGAVAVRIAPFRIGRDEVTRAQFRAFIEHSGYRNAAWATHPCESAAGHATHWDEPGYTPVDDEPVDCVSLRDAHAYADWLTHATGHSWRLPTEAEWEYAARGATNGPTWWGEIYRPGVAICSGCGPQQADHALPAAGRIPNPFGLRDVAGNLAELTCSAYTGAADTATHCANDTVTAALRGGSWIDPLEKLNLASRAPVGIDRRTAWIGFRVASEATR